jgi:hypothetical protein
MHRQRAGALRLHAKIAGKHTPEEAADVHAIPNGCQR